MPLLTIILYIFIALAPGVFWVWFFYRKDNIQPEPKKMIMAMFFWGMLATIPTLVVEFGIILFIGGGAEFTASLAAAAVGAFIVVAPAEEIFKYLAIRRFIYRNPYFDESLDGVIYAVTAGLGFASAENILVIFSGGAEDIFWRALTATLLHALASGILGYFIGLGKFNPAKMKIYVLQGLGLAIGLHGLYDFVASVEFPMRLATLITLNIIAYLLLGLGIRKLKAIDLAKRKSRQESADIVSGYDVYRPAKPPSEEQR